ncbi:hypothetical protein Tco_0342663, partial [Tanacetum coccineum]
MNMGSQCTKLEAERNSPHIGNHAIVITVIRKTKEPSTDIAKITRKRSKPDKHEHGKGKIVQEPGDCK